MIRNTIRNTLVVAALAAALSGCQGGPGESAYGFPDRPPPRPSERTLRVEPLAGGALRPIAIGQLDDLTIQPIGARYSESGMVDRVAPGAGIEQTYFYWATVPTLRHAVRDGLVSHNVKAFCDDADLGVSVPYGGSAYPTGVLLLRGELVDFVYSRTDGRDILSATVSWTLLDGDSGRVVGNAQHEAAIEAREAESPGQKEDPFKALGQRLSAKLLADPVIRAALTSKPWSGAGSGSVEAGTPRGQQENGR